MTTKKMQFKDLQVGDTFIYNVYGKDDFVCIKLPPCYQIPADPKILSLCNAFCIKCSIKRGTKKERDNFRKFFENQFLSFDDRQMMKKMCE